MFGYGRFGVHHGPGPIGWLFLALLLALVVLAVLAVVRLWRAGGGANTHHRPPPGPAVDPALTELRIRYARGDISWDEYARRAAHLGLPVTWGPPPGAPGEGQPGGGYGAVPGVPGVPTPPSGGPAVAVPPPTGPPPA